MTRREKELLARVYRVLNEAGGLRASNPADIKTISLYHNQVPRILHSLNLAISCLGYGDLGECAHYLRDAEGELQHALRG